MYRLLIACLLWLPLGAGMAAQFEAFSAEYRLYRGGSTLGSGVLSLRPTDEPDCYVYSYTATPAWILRWATGELTERSEFCRQDEQLIPLRYTYKRDGFGADDENYSLQFDQEKATVTDHKGNTREWPVGSVDRLLMQLEAQRLVDGLSLPPPERRLSVTMVEDDRIRSYTLGTVGSETIRTPAGEFETIRVERLNDKRKTTRFWVAPALGYQLVKVEQQKRDDPPIGFELKRLPKSQK